MSELAKKRIKGYLQTFTYMTVCGVLFVLGGGAFFIHESITMENHKHPEHDVISQASSDDLSDKDKDSPGNHVPDYREISTATYAKELRTVGYVFLGVGAIFVAIGLPLVYQFWKRYQNAKELERCPMLDPMYQKQLQEAYYTSPSGRPGLKSKKLAESSLTKEDGYNKPKPKRKWFWSRQPSVTAESFRIAAHHHPSFNLVPIESLAALSRNEQISDYSDANSDLNPLSSASTETPSDHVQAEVQQQSTSLFGRMFGVDLDNSGGGVGGGYENEALSCIDESDSLSRDEHES